MRFKENNRTMFNDEMERELLSQNHESMSIQSWAAQLAQEAQNHQSEERNLSWRYLLNAVGRSLITFGSSLTQRFGSPEDNARGYVPTPQDRAYN